MQKSLILCAVAMLLFVGCIKEEPKPKTTTQIVQEKIEKSWDKTKEYTGEKYEDSKEWVSDKYDDSKDYIKDKYEDIKDKILD